MPAGGGFSLVWAERGIKPKNGKPQNEISQQT